MARIVSLFVTLLILYGAVYYDTRTMKIPNNITFPAIISGLIYTLLLFHWGSFISSLVAIVVVFFLGILDLMGMGDLKLCMAVIAWRGWRQTLYMVLFACLFMLIYCILEDHDRALQEIKETIFKILYKIPICKGTGKEYPFSVFLAFGFFASQILSWII